MGAKQTKFTITLIVLILFIVAILAAGLFVYSRQYLAVKQLNIQTAQVEGQVQKIEKFLTREKALSEEYANLTERLKILERDQPDFKYMPTYLRDMQRVAKRTGNTIQSIQPQDMKPLDVSKIVVATPEAVDADAPVTETDPAAAPVKETAPTMVQRINLDVRGSYGSVMRLLDELRRFPKLVYVRTISLSPSATEQSKGVTARLETYAIITPDQYEPSDDDAAKKPVGAKPAQVAGGSTR